MSGKSENFFMSIEEKSEFLMPVQLMEWIYYLIDPKPFKLHWNYAIVGFKYF